jgi:hypothetical protein
VSALRPTTEAGLIDWAFLDFEKRTKVLDGEVLHQCGDCRLWLPRDEYLYAPREFGDIGPKCVACWERPYLVMSGR